MRLRLLFSGRLFARRCYARGGASQDGRSAWKQRILEDRLVPRRRCRHRWSLLFNRASDLIPSLERKAYDLGVQATSREPVRQDRGHRDRRAQHRQHRALAVVARGAGEDDRSARRRQGEGRSATRSFFSEPQIDPGYAYITKLLDLRKICRAAPATHGAAPIGRSPAAAPDALAPIVALLKEAEQSRSTPTASSRRATRKAGNVLLPMLFDDRRAAAASRTSRCPSSSLKNAIAMPKGGARRVRCLTLRGADCRSTRSAPRRPALGPPQHRCPTSTAACAPSRWCCSTTTSISVAVADARGAEPEPRPRPTSRCSWARASALGRLRHPHRPARCRCTPTSTRTATAGRRSASIRSTTCYTGKIPAAKYARQDRADRRDRRRPRRDPGDAGLAGDGAGADARALGVVDPAGAFLRRADLGLLGRAAACSCWSRAYLIVLLPRLTAGPALRSSRRRVRRAARRALRADDRAADVAAAHAAGDAAARRPRAR